MAYEIKGIVKSVSEVQQVTEKFAKREIVIEHADNPKYPQLSKFETSGDRNALLDSVSSGDVITIHFNLDGREAKNGNVYNTLKIWKLNVDVKASKPAASGFGDQDSIPF